MIRTLIVDDRQLLRESLFLLLRESTHIVVVATARDVASALAMVADLTPDVMVLGMRMSGSTELVRKVLARFEATRVVALGNCDEPGVTVLQDGSVQDLIAAIHQASHSTAADLEVMAPLRLEGARLSPREQAIVHMIDQGLSNKEIARALHVSVSTVKTHVHSILDKLQVSGRREAVTALRRAPE